MYSTKDHTGPLQALDWSTEPRNSSYLIKSCTSVPEQFVCKLSDKACLDPTRGSYSIFTAS